MTRSVIFLQPPQMPRQRATRKAVSVLMSRADGARPAAVTESSRSRCIFFRMYMCPCEVCKGKRYNRETLEVKYKGKSIYDVLDMTVEEALTFFENVPSIRRKIETLYDVGLSISVWVSPPPLFPEEKHSVSSLPQNSASAVPERRSISWMSLPQDCTLRMSTS